MPDNPEDLSSTVRINAADALAEAEAMRQELADQQARGFAPSPEWQRIPEGTAVPPGGEFRMDMETGVNMGRWPDMAPLRADFGKPLITVQEMQDFWAGETSSAAPPTPVVSNSGYMGGLQGYEDTFRREELRREDAQWSRSGAAFTGVPDPTFRESSERRQAQEALAARQATPAAASAAPAEDRWAAIGDGGRVDSGFSDASANAAIREPGAYTAADRFRDAVQPTLAPVADRFRGYAARGLARVSDATAGSALSGLAGMGVDALGGLPAGPLDDEEEATSSAAPRSRGGSHGQGQWILGGQIAQIGEDAGRYYDQTNSGRYLTPEQQTTAAASFIPGAAGLAGYAIGSAIPGVGPVLGAMGGQAIGSVVQGVIGADDEKNQALRETSERLATALGAGADAAERFRSQMETMGASVQLVSEGLKTLQGLSPGVGADAITGAAKMSLAEGDRYQEDTAGVGKFLSSDPALFGLKSTFATSGGDLSATDYRGIASLALSRGDVDAYNAAQDSASAARYAADPDYQRLARQQQGVNGSWWDEARHGLTEAGETLNKHLGIASPILSGPTSVFGMAGSDPVPDAQDALDAQKRKIDAQNAATGAQDLSLSLQLGQARYDVGASQTQAAIGESGYDLLKTEGGGAANLAALLPGIRQSLTAASAADQTFIDNARNSIAGLDPKDPAQAALIQGYQSDILRYTQDQASNPLKMAGLERQSFEDRFGEERAGFGLSVTRARIEGASAEDIYERTQAQSRYLQGVEADPRNPIGPAERAQIEQGRLSSVYAARMGVYGENVAQDDLSISQTGAAVGQARAFGTPGQIDQAFAGQADAYGAKIRELTEELNRGGLIVTDRIAKERELAQAQQSLADVEAQRRDQAVQSAYGQDSDQRTIDTAGMGHRVRVGGTVAVDVGALDRDWNRTLGDDQAAIGKYAPGSDQWQQARAKLATDQADLQDQRDQLNVYSPDARTRSADTLGDSRISQAEHAFRRAEAAPYSDAGGDPFSRGQALQSEIGRGESRLTSDWKREEDFRAQRIGQGRWDDAAQAGYDQDFARYQDRLDSLKDRRADLDREREEAMYGAIPEMVAGSPGRGLGAALITPAAMAAVFQPGAHNGSWGSPPASHWGGQSPYGHAAVGGYDAGAAAMAGGGDSEQNRLLSAILTELQTQGRHIASPARFQPTVPQHNVNAVAGALDFAYNPHTGQ